MQQNNGKSNTNGNGLKPLGGQLKKLDVQEIPAPQFDDDDDDLGDLLVVKKDETAGARANENFLKSMMKLQEGTR